MKTAFDKIYCINFLPNKYRREFMQYQFNDLGLENYCSMTKEEIIDYLSEYCEPKTVELLKK